MDDDGADVAVGETGELLLRNPAVTPGYWGMPEETAAALVRRLAAHRRPRDARTPTAPTPSSSRQEGGAPPPRARTCRRPRWRRRSPAHPRRARGAVVGVPSELTEDEVKAFVVPRPDDAGLRRAADLDRPSGWQRSRCRATGRLVDGPAAHADPRVAKHQLPDRPPGRASSTPKPRIATMTELPDRRSAPPTRDHHPARPRPRRRPDGSGRLRRARVLAGRACAGRPRASCGCSKPCSSRWPTTASPRSRDRRAADAHRRAGVGAGRARRRAARRRLAVPRRHRGRRRLPGRRAGRAQAADSRCRTATTAGTTWLAPAVARRSRRAAACIPGLGHPVHKAGDPRTPGAHPDRRRGAGLRGPHLRLFEAVGRVHPELLGRTLPLNGAGVCGAALCRPRLPRRHRCAASPCWPGPPGLLGPHRRGDAPADRSGDLRRRRPRGRLPDRRVADQLQNRRTWPGAPAGRTSRSTSSIEMRAPRAAQAAAKARRPLSVYSISMTACP